MKIRSLMIFAASLGLLAASANRAFAPLLGPLETPIPVFVGSDAQFTLIYLPGSNYVLQGSTGLTSTNWVNIITNSADASGKVVLTDTNAMNVYPQRFYRIVLVF
jgi:hypothetical protein